MPSLRTAQPSLYVSFALWTEYAINVGPRGASDGATQRKTAARTQSQIGAVAVRFATGPERGSGLKLLSALLVSPGATALQDDLHRLRLLHVVLGFLLS